MIKSKGIMKMRISHNELNKIEWRKRKYNLAIDFINNEVKVFQNVIE